MKREDIEQATDAAAKLALWLSGDIELEPLETLEHIGDLLELALDALTKASGHAPR